MSRGYKAVAYQATLQGFDVRYVEADTEFARYGLCSTAEQATLLRSFVEPDLVVLDDLFLARRISEASAELLQTVVHQRYKQRRSIIVTSNRVVQDWGKYLVCVRPTHLDDGWRVQGEAMGRQRCGSSSSMRLAGCSGSRSSTSQM